MKQVLSAFAATALTAAGLTMFGPAQAQTNCDVTGSDFEDVYCLAKTFVKDDDDLNVVYQKLIRRLSPSAQVSLRRYQRAWVERRNTDTSSKDSKAGTVIDLDLAVNMTTERFNFLNDRYRECLSSGCQPGKLK